MPAHPQLADAARGGLELASIVRAHGAALRAGQGLSGAQLKALRAIERCRTEQLGGHIAQCNHCGAQQFHYHSCRNRHCPKCQTLCPRSVGFRADALNSCPCPISIWCSRSRTRSMRLSRATLD